MARHSGPPITGDIALMAALHRLDRLSTDELPEAAAQALAAGRDSPSLRRLAGYVGHNPFELEDLLQRALAELGLRPDTEQRALEWLARYRAEQIVKGELDPVRGAGMIWRLFDDYPPHVMPFLQLEDEYEDPWLRKQRRRIRRDIVAEAKRFLDERRQAGH